MEQILHSITAAGYRQLQGKGIALYRYDAVTDTFPDMWRMEDCQITRRYQTQVSRAGMTATVLREGRLLLVPDVLQARVSKELPGGIRSFVAVPVTVHGIPWGVLYVNSLEPNGFCDHDLQFVEALARQIGIFAEGSHTVTSGSVELSTVRVLAATVDAKDPYTRNHSTNVAFLARRLAREMSLDPAEVHRIDLAALLHDIGKIAIPDYILQKPGALLEEEWLIVQTHAAIGANILSQAFHMRHLVSLVRHHHERWDGKGYPDRLKEEDIPLGAAIISLADAFDAMTTSRMYRPAFTLEQTMIEVKRCKGTQFHPEVVEAMKRVIERARDQQEPWLVALENCTGLPLGQFDGPSEQGALEEVAGGLIQLKDPLDFLVEASSLPRGDDLSGVLMRSGEQIRNFWGSDAVQIYLVNPADSTLRLAWSDGSEVGRRFLATCQRENALPMSQGLLGWVALSNQVATVSDGRRDPRWPHGGTFSGPVSVLVAPVTSGGSASGVIQLVQQGESRFGRADMKVLRVFGSLLGQAIERAQDRTANKDSLYTDPLTGVWNTTYLGVVLKHMEAERLAGPISVAYFDGDNLKQSNDRHGHDIGNRIIQHIARCTAAHRRPEDVLIRFAGDEFLMFFPGLALPEASAVLERMRMAVAETPVELPGGQRIYVSVSCGVAEVDHDTGPNKAMRSAEQAMYNAKRTGKNRIWTAAV